MEYIPFGVVEGGSTNVNIRIEGSLDYFGMEKTDAPGEGIVTRYGTVNGRLVYAYAQDFTVIGGSLGEVHAAKICKVLDPALKWGLSVSV